MLEEHDKYIKKIERCARSCGKLRAFEKVYLSAYQEYVSNFLRIALDDTNKFMHPEIKARERALAVFIARMKKWEHANLMVRIGLPEDEKEK